MKRVCLWGRAFTVSVIQQKDPALPAQPGQIWPMWPVRHDVGQLWGWFLPISNERHPEGERALVVTAKTSDDVGAQMACTVAWGGSAA